MDRPLAFLILLLSALALAGCDADRARFERACSRCHSADLPLGKSYDRGVWEETVRRMSEHAVTAGFGPIPAEEQRSITDYLIGRQTGR